MRIFIFSNAKICNDNSLFVWKKREKEKKTDVVFVLVFSHLSPSDMNWCLNKQNWKQQLMSMSLQTYSKRNHLIVREWFLSSVHACWIVQVPIDVSVRRTLVNRKKSRLVHWTAWRISLEEAQFSLWILSRNNSPCSLKFCNYPAYVDMRSIKM